MSSPFSDDDELMVEIQRALTEANDVPVYALEQARAAFELKTVDQELELLTMLYDSSKNFDIVVRDASFVAARTLSFVRGDMSVDLEMEAGWVLGQVMPPQLATVSILTVEGVFSTCDTDEVGTFRLRCPAVGSIRLTCTLGRLNLATNWISL